MAERTWDEVVSSRPLTPSYEANVARTLYQENTLLRSAIEEAIEELRGNGDRLDITDGLKAALAQCDQLP